MTAEERFRQRALSALRADESARAARAARTAQPLDALNSSGDDAWEYALMTTSAASSRVGLALREEFAAHLDALRLARYDRAVSALPAPLRAVWARLIDGRQSVDEVAIALSLSPRTVRRRRSAALRAVRRACQDDVPVARAREDFAP